MKRPFVYVNMAMTVDGKITSSHREYPGFSSKSDRKNMDRLRAEADALAVGAGTIRADNPKLHVRDEAMQDYRRSLGKPAGLTKILITSSADLPPDSRFFDSPDGGAGIIATVETAEPSRLAALAERVEVWTLGHKQVDLDLLLERLADRGIRRLLLEGGGELNWAFVEADLVDEFHVTIAPALLGGRDAPTLLEGSGLRMRDQRRLKLAELRRDGDELFCRYTLVR